MVEGTSEERWLPVPGFERYYGISDFGRVYSKPRLVRHPLSRTGYARRVGRILKTCRTAGDHRSVVLVDPAVDSELLIGVHRLVLLAFVGEPPPGRPYACHRNDVGSDNRLENLYWGSPQQNSLDSVRNGNHTQARKVACGLEHLLIEPNLVPSTSKHGYRSCLACKRTSTAHNADHALHEQGRVRTRHNRGKDGFRRRFGEPFADEANRRYVAIMGAEAHQLIA